MRILKILLEVLIRPIAILAFLMSESTVAEAAQTLVFDIKCVDAYIKQGRPKDDFRKKTGQPIECGDSAVLSMLDNGRVLLQVATKGKARSTVYGFAGSGFERLSNELWLMPVEHMYLPPTGTTADVDLGLGGGCIFAGSSDNIGETESISCTTNIIPNELLRTVYRVKFDIVRKPEPVVTQEAASRNSFDKISQYTLMNEMLPDGKHPVWIYYEVKGKTIIRLTMPSLDICGVMPESKSDIDILRSKKASNIQKDSTEWDMALRIWKTAFDRYLLTGIPTRCGQY